MSLPTINWQVDNLFRVEIDSRNITYVIVIGGNVAILINEGPRMRGGPSTLPISKGPIPNNAVPVFGKRIGCRYETKFALFAVAVACDICMEGESDSDDVNPA